jgi:hypothetical protein
MTIESKITIGWKRSPVLTVFGASALAVVIFEVLLNTTSIFWSRQQRPHPLAIDSWRRSNEWSSNSRIDKKGQSKHLS